MSKVTQPLEAYRAALARLRAGRPQVVAKGTRITNDSVSIEAGRGKGSIKRSRTVFADLIADIDEAAKEQVDPERLQRDKLLRTRGREQAFRRDWEATLVREVSLLKEIWELRRQIAQLTGQKVLPIRGRSSLNDD
jgi:hypothetical protein